MKKQTADQALLSVEELDHRIAPGLTDLCGVVITVPTLPTTECPPPPPSNECPPPPPEEECPPSDETTESGNNGYGNDGYDGVPGGSADNDSPNSDEKEADQVR